MSTISATTIRRLRRVRAAILANPRLYNQNSIQCADESCGTAACILGWANTLFPKTSKRQRDAAKKSWNAEDEHYFSVLSPDARRTLTCGTAALYLTAVQAKRLWTPDQWPNPFRDEESRAYYELGSSEFRRAAAWIAARRITHFIRTDGKE